ncbi:MAG TPA: hypothetical protein VEH77_16780 [Roseiarcus sp.]|nr:hypothetical protein [Roseiarcus sp.]
MQLFDLAPIGICDAGAQPRRGRGGRLQFALEFEATRLELLQLLRQAGGGLSVGQRVDQPVDLPADALPLVPKAGLVRAGLGLQPVPFGGDSSAKTLNRSGSMSRLLSPSMTVASSASRRMVKRFPHTASPLLRAAEQPKCASLILEKPPPQTPQRMSPEKR